MIRRALLVVVLLVALAAVAVVAPVSADPGSITHLWSHLRPKVAATQPWAVVASAGTVTTSSGVTGVQKSGTGTYVVDFTRDISNCSFVVTVVNNFRTSTVIWTAGVDGDVTVQTLSPTTAVAQDSAFVIQGSCT